MELTTITISTKTKELLEIVKGKKTWDEFLREIALELLKKRRESIRKKLGELFEESFEKVKVRKWAREF